MSCEHRALIHELDIDELVFASAARWRIRLDPADHEFEADSCPTSNG